MNTAMAFAAGIAGGIVSNLLSNPLTARMDRCRAARYRGRHRKPRT